MNLTNCDTDEVEIIRKTYNIDKKYKAYLLHGQKTYIKWLDEIRKECDGIITLNINDYTKDIKEENHNGMIKKDYYYLVLLQNQEIGFNTYLFIEKKNLKRFLKENINFPKNSKKNVYGSGIFRIIKTPFGITLEKLNIGEVNEKPILNDNIYQNTIDEIESFVRKKEVYNKLGITYKRGLLFYGPPGNGKTLMIKNILKSFEERACCILIDLNEYSNLKFISDLFIDKTYKEILKIIVLEDIDGIDGSDRSFVLNLLDGVVPVNNVIFIATTNHPSKVDNALMNRPSRFDTIQAITTPNTNSRTILINNIFSGLSNKDIEILIKESEGISGAHFNEINVLSKLHSIKPIDALRIIKKRYTDLCKFKEEETDGTNYIG